MQLRLAVAWQILFRLGSDDGLELLISQLVDCHDVSQLLSIPCLVLHEVWDADFLHLSRGFQAVNVFK